MGDSHESVFEHPLVAEAGIVFRGLTQRHAEILRSLDKPAIGLRTPIRLIANHRFGLAVVSDEERSEILFVLGRPLVEVEEALRRGRTAFRLAAMQVVGDRLPDVLIEELFSVALKHLDDFTNL